jgi:hypothetical protein
MASQSENIQTHLFTNVRRLQPMSGGGNQCQAVETNEGRWVDIDEFLEWMLGTTSYNGKTCVRALFVFEKLISLEGESSGDE